MSKKLKLLSSLDKKQQVQIINLINNRDVELMNITSPKGDKGVLWIDDKVETLVILDFPKANGEDTDFDDGVLDLLEDLEDDDDD
jgi:hypothetical protein